VTSARILCHSVRKTIGMTRGVTTSPGWEPRAHHYILLMSLLTAVGGAPLQLLSPHSVSLWLAQDRPRPPKKWKEKYAANMKKSEHSGISVFCYTCALHTVDLSSRIAYAISQSKAHSTTQIVSILINRLIMKNSFMTCSCFNLYWYNCSDNGTQIL